MILALDPSSTKCGYAVMADAGLLVDAGLLTPNKSRDTALYRIPAIALDLQDLIAEVSPSTILIEVSMTSHGRAGSAGAKTLHVYGMAVGYLWSVCESAAPECICTVEATTWTQGIEKKKRTARIASLYPRRYDPARDPGGDVADAIGLGRWWLLRSLGRVLR